MNIESWAWLVIPLGACRAMQIALWDRVFHRQREWLLKKLNPKGLPMSDPDRPYISYLLECPWCISVWIGLLIVVGLVVEATTTVTLWILTFLAISLAAVVLDRLIDVYASDEAAERRAARLAPPPPATAIATGMTFDPSAAAAIPPAVAAAFDQAERRAGPDPIPYGG